MFNVNDVILLILILNGQEKNSTGHRCRVRFLVFFRNRKRLFLFFFVVVVEYLLEYSYTLISFYFINMFIKSRQTCIYNTAPDAAH